MRQFLILTFLLAFCAGCNDMAERQHRAEQARQRQTAKDLKELGQKMHNQAADKPAADATATDVSETTSDSPPGNGETSR